MKAHLIFNFLILAAISSGANVALAQQGSDCKENMAKPFGFMAQTEYLNGGLDIGATVFVVDPTKYIGNRSRLIMYTGTISRIDVDKKIAYIKAGNDTTPYFLHNLFAKEETSADFEGKAATIVDTSFQTFGGGSHHYFHPAKGTKGKILGIYRNGIVRLQVRNDVVSYDYRGLLF